MELRSKCHNAPVFWKEKEYFGKYTKTIWICFKCYNPTEVKEKKEEK